MPVRKQEQTKVSASSTNNTGPVLAMACVLALAMGAAGAGLTYHYMMGEAQAPCASTCSHTGAHANDADDAAATGAGDAASGGLVGAEATLDRESAGVALHANVGDVVEVTAIGLDDPAVSVQATLPGLI